MKSKPFWLAFVYIALAAGEFGAGGLNIHIGKNGIDTLSTSKENDHH